MPADRSASIPDDFRADVYTFLARALHQARGRTTEQIWTLADGELEAHLIVAPSTWRPSRGIPLMPILPAATGAASSASTSALPTDLNNIELAVMQAATDRPQTAKELARRAGYSIGRVREAVARLTSRNPPLLMRTAQGLRLMPRH